MVRKRANKPTPTGAGDEAGREELEAALEAALEAYASGRGASARELLDAVDVGKLSLPDRYRAESLLAELGEPESVPSQEEAYEREIARDDPLAALHCARRLAEASRDKQQKQRWLERCEKLRPKVRELCRVEVARQEAHLDDCLKVGFYYQRSHVWLDDEGRRLVIVNAFNEWLFIRVVDIERGKVVERVSLKPPEPIARPIVTCLDGQRLWVAGAQGHVIELSSADWRVLGWYPTTGFLPQGYTIEAAVVFPHEAHLWMEVRSSDDEPETLVVDLTAWRLDRRLSGGMASMIPLVGREGCRVVYSSNDLGTGLYTQDGTILGAERMLGCGVSGATVAPEDQGILFLVNRAVWQVECGLLSAAELEARGTIKDRCDVLVWAEPAANGSTRINAELDLGRTLPLGDRRVATSLEEGLCFVLVTRNRDQQEVLAISVSRQADSAHESLEILYRFFVPYGAMLLRDRFSCRVMALVFSEEGIRMIPLSREAPAGVLPSKSGERHEHVHMPSVHSAGHCGAPTGDVKAGVEQLATPLEEASYHELELMLEEFQKQEHEVDLEHLIYLCLALRKSSYLIRDKVSGFVDRLAERHPGHPALALMLAEQAADNQDWPMVLNLLGSLEPRGLDDGRARHFYHLRGLALLHAEEPDKGFEAFTAATLYEQGSCELQGLLHLTGPMGDPPEAQEWGAGEPRVRQVLGALRTVDHQLRRGDPESARALLEQQHLWSTSEQQLTARLAAVYLDLPAGDVAERFYKRLALARFCFFRGLDGRFFDKELVLPGLSWDEVRLEDLERRARAWLDVG